MTEWKLLKDESPPDDMPCEYRIMVTCQGWYRGDPKDHRFAADERLTPHAELYAWRPWTDGPTWEEGFKAVREYRNNLKEQHEN